MLVNRIFHGYDDNDNVCGSIWMYVVDVHVYYPAIMRDIPWDCPQHDMALAIEKSIILGDSWDENKIYKYIYILYMRYQNNHIILILFLLIYYVVYI